MATTVVLPQLSYPFEAEVSPYAREVDDHTLAWGNRHGIFDALGGDAERYRGSRVG